MNIPRYIAHRGANRLAPENTLKAFQIAEALGATLFECDVLLTADQIPIIFHDDTLERTTNGTGQIRAMPWAILNTLDAGEGERIPTLSQLLAWLNDSKMNLNLELKYSHNTDHPEPLVKIVCRQLPPNQERFLISSFNLKALRAVRTALPHIKIGLLIDKENLQTHGFAKIAQLFKSLNAFSIHCDEHLLTQKTILTFLKISPNLFSYTVNDPQRAATLFKQGVKALFTDSLIDIYSSAPS